MTAQTLPDGVVYTETVVHSAPERYAAEAPYQIAIVEFEDGVRRTARIAGSRVSIGGNVEFVEFREGVPVYKSLQT